MRSGLGLGLGEVLLQHLRGTEVRELAHTLGIDEDVSALDVPVHHLPAV